MDIALDPSIAEGYDSKAQQTRGITEHWAEENLYCLNCEADRIKSHRPGKKVEDFFCSACDRRVQFKATRGSHGNKVTGAAYEPTMEAVRNDDAPDYAFMSFDPDSWRVTDLFVVPGRFLTPSVIEKREPLSSDARRSGWVGSYILLDNIPEVGRITLVQAGEVISPEEVRQQFEQTTFLSRKEISSRDWTTAVMNCIDELPARPGDEFTLEDVYEFEDRLAEMYPENQHVRAKIRQQLQVLRDQGLIDFLGDGEYRLRWVDTRE
jgi:type II restriction enzyme